MTRTLGSYALRPSGGSGPWPLVSIVVALHNEGRHLQAAITSLLQFDYPCYVQIAVDDRSEDGTPAILKHLADDFPRLKSLRIDVLPNG